MPHRVNFTDLECSAFIEWVERASLKDEKWVLFKGVEYPIALATDYVRQLREAKLP